MATNASTPVFRVVAIRPKDSVCGGNPATEERAAKRYAMMPVCLQITKRPQKDFRNIKLHTTRFFKDNRLHPAPYTVEERGSFPTYNEAEAYMLSEARACQHFVKFRDTWIQL